MSDEYRSGTNEATTLNKPLPPRKEEYDRGELGPLGREMMFPPRGPDQRERRIYRGAADCKAIVIYGAPGATGTRQGKIVIEQVPDRSVLRMRVMGYDRAGQKVSVGEVELDDGAYNAIKEAFSGYSNARIDPPTATPPADRVSETINELAGLADLPGLSQTLRDAIERAIAGYVAGLDGEPRKGPAANSARRRMDFDSDAPAAVPTKADVVLTDAPGAMPFAAVRSPGPPLSDSALAFLQERLNQRDAAAGQLIDAEDDNAQTATAAYLKDERAEAVNRMVLATEALRPDGGPADPRD